MASGLAQLGYDLEPTEVATLMQQLDLNADGQVRLTMLIMCVGAARRGGHAHAAAGPQRRRPGGCPSFSARVCGLCGSALVISCKRLGCGVVRDAFVPRRPAPTHAGHGPRVCGQPAGLGGAAGEQQVRAGAASARRMGRACAARRCGSCGSSARAARSLRARARARRPSRPHLPSLLPTRPRDLRLECARRALAGFLAASTLPLPPPPFWPPPLAGTCGWSARAARLRAWTPTRTGGCRWRA